MESSIYLVDALIRRYCPDKRDKLAKYLENADAYYQTSFSSKKFDLEDFSLDHYLQQIHYSWWIEPLKEFKKDAQLFIPLFSDEIRKPLIKILDLKETSPIANQKLENFLKHALVHALNDPLPIPFNYLPKSLMRMLLTLSKKDLVSLIDHLSLYDLAFEMKRIVDTKILKPLYSYMDKKETLFLKKISKSAESFSLTKMDLNKWDREEKSLRMQMHKRGILRLSIALHYESKDLIWHIAHRLDIGRGSLLMKSTDQKIAASIINSIQANIVELVEEENF